MLNSLNFQTIQVGRVTLELLRNCQNLSIDHSDDTANKLQVLEQLMDKERIQWYQQVEGKSAQRSTTILIAKRTKLLSRF